MTTQIDHIIIAVRDLDRAAQDYALLLGRAPSWRGGHPDYGSRNVLFRLDNIYLELLAPDGDGELAARLNAHLDAHGESLFGLVFGADDLDALVENMRAGGVKVSDPVAGHGVDEAGGAMRHWRSAFWPTEAARGVFSFAISHDDPDALPLAPVEAEGAPDSIDHVVLRTADAEAACAFYGERLGIRLAQRMARPEWGGEFLFFRASHMSIEVIASEKNDATRDSLWGLALRTSDMAATHKRLEAAGVAVSEIRDGRKEGTKVCTVKSHCCDVPTLLITHS